MNCANHAEVPAVAFCRTCGKPLCASCVRDIRGVVYCEGCLASQLSGAMPPPGTSAVPPGAQPQAGGGSPGLAALLGFIPGVGAMYNGEYAKGFVHVLIFATLIWMAAHVNGMFGLGIAAFVIYMPIEAYQTARARQMGLPPPDPLGLNRLFSAGGPAPNRAPGVVAGAVPVTETTSAATPEGQPAEAECCPPSRVPIGALVLIGLGVLLLLNQFGLLNFDWDRIWPVILIAIGVGVLFKRRRMGW
jgi:LiaI-LiaF-like transmembrane region/B-box zinc finger